MPYVTRQRGYTIYKEDFGMQTPITLVPEGKPVLEFLQEMDGANEQLKKQWTFLSKELIDVLYQQLGRPTPHVKGNLITFPLLGGTDDLAVASITLMRNLTTGWYTIASINCSGENCPYHLSSVNVFEDEFSDSIFISVAA